MHADKGILIFLKLYAKLCVFAFSWGEGPKLISKSGYKSPKARKKNTVDGLWHQVEPVGGEHKDLSKG